MRILITGAAGFIGAALLRELLARGSLTSAAGAARPITEIALLDRVAPAALPPAGGIALRVLVGDLTEAAFRRAAFAGGFDSIFHLAATLTSEAEQDVAKGLEVNVLGFLHLLEACRAQQAAPKLVFASSIAAFGGDLPETVTDDTPQHPQTAYGTHKVIAEKLIDDHSRLGLIDGRALRLPVVVIRPPGAAPSVSDRIAAIAREPLHGRDVVCPLAPETRVPVASVANVARALVALHEAPAAALGPVRAMNLPALSVTIAEMIAALGRVGAGRRRGQVVQRPDPALQAIVDGWPKRFESARARRFGIAPDESYDAILTQYLENAA